MRGDPSIILFTWRTICPTPIIFDPVCWEGLGVAAYVIAVFGDLFQSTRCWVYVALVGIPVCFVNSWSWENVNCFWW